MEKRKTKKDIVKMLLNQNLEIEDEEQLIDLLIDQSIAIDVDKEEERTMRFGDRLSDKITEIAGSWSFIIGFVLFLIIWIIINILCLNSVDPYPFILLNLLLSCIAALQAPIIMMSQNRQSKKDSLRSKYDYKADLKSELIAEELHNQMSELLKTERKILREIEKISAEDNNINDNNNI